MTLRLYRADIWAGDTPSCRDRITDADGVNLTQADVATITRDVVDASRGKSLQLAQSVTVASVVYDTLQTDAMWTVDTDGYNFKCTVPGSLLPHAGRIYRVRFNITTTGGTLFYSNWEFHTHESLPG